MLMIDAIGRFLRLLLVEHWPITVVTAVGLAAVFVLLPRPRAPSRTWGAALAGLAVLLAGALIVRVGIFHPETILFYAFSGTAVVAGGLLVTQSNPARAALAFALVILSTCGLFLLLAAPFLMAATTIIYAGAIIVTFLFVIMLARQEGISDADQRSREPLLSSVTGFILLGALLYVLNTSYGTAEIDGLLARARHAQAQDSVEAMARALGDEEDKNAGFFSAFGKAIAKGGETAEAQELIERTLINLQYSWGDCLHSKDAQKAREVLEALQKVGAEARNSYGAFQPHAGKPLSFFSGPAANVSLHEKPPQDERPATPGLRRDARTGVPELPAENTAYIGRALFTDYLLAVELAGTLLLVATIGAIAIAGRRGEKNP
jgi:NADH:ubiquinone oxidoreductase subunit 6 (subunit J)